MHTLLQALIAPITSAWSAITITVLLPWFLWPALVAFVAFTVWGLQKRERLGRAFLWNALPLVVIWPIVGLSATVWWEKPQYIDAITVAIVPYLVTVTGAVVLTRKTGFLALAVQSLIFIYALGESMLCSMAITGKWL